LDEDVTDATGLRISNVTKGFATPEGGVVQALDGVSLTIGVGEFFVMLGPSGCGKTTLLRAIAGLEHLDSGMIQLDGERIDQQPPFARPVNTVFQSYALFPHLTVAENVAFGLEMDKRPRAEITETVARMLELVHLGDLSRRKPNQLSGGQQQRVALARALAKSPRVLLLDEPLAALDLKLRRGMQAELKAIQQATGVTFVFVTHDQEEALSMGDRIAVFNAGKVMQVGSPEEIYEQPVNRFVADFIGETNFLELSVASTGGALTARHAQGAQFPLPEACRGPGTVQVAVRPERVSIGEPGRGLPARVETAVYMGTDQRCDVRVDGGPVLRARIAAGVGQQRREVGDRVSVAILPEHLKVMQHDGDSVGEAEATRSLGSTPPSKGAPALEDAR
jgi:spermidine/putrescine transport system ATP-binding protein